MSYVQVLPAGDYSIEIVQYYCNGSISELVVELGFLSSEVTVLDLNSFLLNNETMIVMNLGIDSSVYVLVVSIVDGN